MVPPMHPNTLLIFSGDGAFHTSNISPIGSSEPALCRFEMLYNRHSTQIQPRKKSTEKSRSCRLLHLCIHGLHPKPDRADQVRDTSSLPHLRCLGRHEIGRGQIPRLRRQYNLPFEWGLFQHERRFSRVGRAGGRRRGREGRRGTRSGWEF